MDVDRRRALDRNRNGRRRHELLFIIKFRIGSNARRRLEDVFRAYAAEVMEPAFDRSEVKVRLFTGEPYISRSQARRLLTGLDQFRRVVLDFKGVPTVGQGFADEIYRVFALKHPQVVIETKNMNEIVRFMLERARGTAT